MSFFGESIKNLKTVGTFTRSSSQLCKSAIKHVDFINAQFIVELGAGDGVITEHILEGMRDDGKLIVFEVNPQFCRILREISDKRLIVIEDSAEKMDQYLEKYGFSRVDYIISAIPFVVVPEKLAFTIVEACQTALKSGGKFIQVHYSLLMRKMYAKVFGNVAVNFVLINLPPAWVMVSVK
jgi:phospholipid N-methyltransferase